MLFGGDRWFVSSPDLSPMRLICGLVHPNCFVQHRILGEAALSVPAFSSCAEPVSRFT